MSSLEEIAANRPNVCAVFLEAIQGEGGIQPARIEYLKQVRALCDRKGWLMMVDEVQCGTGRTGRWFAHQYAGIIPDVMPLAKGLASGIPVGAVVAHGEAAHTFKAGNHGTTFGGNPLAMRAGLTTIDVMEEDRLLDNATAMGNLIMDGIRREMAGNPGLIEVRGNGLMIGIELDRPCGEIVGKALKAGLVLNVTADTVVRLLPPLIFNREQAELTVASLAPILREAVARPIDRAA
jgi:acetylornithine aminotransferase